MKQKSIHSSNIRDNPKHNLRAHKLSSRGCNVTTSKENLDNWTNPSLFLPLKEKQIEFYPSLGKMNRPSSK